MQKLWAKIGMIAGFVLLVAMLVFIVKMQLDAKSERDAFKKEMVEMKQLQDGIVRNQSKYVSKDDLEKFAKGMDLNLNAIRKDLEKFGAEVTGISSVLARSIGYKGRDLPSTGTEPKDPDDNTEPPTCPDGTECPDPYGYMSNEQLFSFNEPFTDGTEVPIGTVGFSAWKEDPWSAELFPRTYRVATVLGQDEDGRHYVHNKMEVEVKGEKHTIPIEQAELQEVVPEPKFRFDPHFNLGADIGPTIATKSDPTSEEPKVQAEVVPNLQVTMFSYGETKNDPSVTFLGVGLGYETQRNSLGILLSPVNYNVGQHIPLMDNLYVGPTVGVDIEGNVLVSGGVRVGM